MDATQAEIVKALRRVGCAVCVIGQPVDLLVCGGNPKRTLLLEVKTADGLLTRQQEVFQSIWPGEVHIVRSPREAIACVLGKDAMR